MMAGVSRCVMRSFLMNSGKRIIIAPQYTGVLRTNSSASDVPGVKERTLVAIKPDGVQRRLIGQIIKRFEQRGFRLVGLKMVQAFTRMARKKLPRSLGIEIFNQISVKLLHDHVTVSEELLEQHYVSLRKKPFFPSVLQYMTSGPVVAMVWEGHNVIKSTRMLVGDTNPAEAVPGTLRGDLSVHVSRNVVHASDSPEVALKEISLWFHHSELIDWVCCDHSNIYHP